MCYRCATNPSIHHHHRHIVAMSSPLSHHGVAFTLVTVSSLPSWCRLRCCIIAVSLSQLCRCGAFAVASSRFRHRCCGVAFVVALLPFHHRHRGVAFMSVVVSSLPLRCHLRHRILAVLLLQLCCCGAFAVASSWFRHCRHGVAFIVASSRFHHRCSVAFIIALSRCRCHGFVVTIAVSPSHQLQFRHCHCSITFVIASSWCRHRSRIIAVPSLLHHCGFVVAITVSPSLLHHHGVIVTILLSLSRCRCCSFVVASWCYCCSHIVASSWSWS